MNAIESMAECRLTWPDSSDVGVVIMVMSTWYSGLLLMTTAHIIRQSINLMRYTTGSQCKNVITLLTLSCMPRPSKSQAAALKTHWRDASVTADKTGEHSIAVVDILYNQCRGYALQQSNKIANFFCNLLANKFNVMCIVLFLCHLFLCSVDYLTCISYILFNILSMCALDYNICKQQNLICWMNLAILNIHKMLQFFNRGTWTAKIIFVIIRWDLRLLYLITFWIFHSRNILCHARCSKCLQYSAVLFQWIH